MTIDLDRRYRFEEPLFETVAQCFDTAILFLQRCRSEFGCFSKSNNRGGIFGSAAFFVLLATADQVGNEPCSAIDVQRSDPLRRMQFVARKRKEVDWNATQVDVDLSDGLNRVRVEKSSFRAANFSGFFNRENGPGLIVGP